MKKNFKKETLLINDLTKEETMRSFNYENLALYGMTKEEFKTAQLEAEYGEDGTMYGVSLLTLEYMANEKRSRNELKKSNFILKDKANYVENKYGDLGELDEDLTILLAQQIEDDLKGSTGKVRKPNGGITVRFQQFNSFFNEEGELVEFWSTMKKMPYGLKLDSKVDINPFVITRDLEDLVEFTKKGAVLKVEAIGGYAEQLGVYLDGSCYRAVVSGDAIRGMLDISESEEFEGRLGYLSEGIYGVKGSSYSDKDVMAIEINQDSKEIIYGRSNNISSSTAVNAGAWDERVTAKIEDFEADKFAKRDKARFYARRKSSSWAKEDFLFENDAVVEFIEDLNSVELNLARKALLQTDIDKSLIIKCARYMRDLKMGELNKALYQYASVLEKQDRDDDKYARALQMIRRLNHEQTKEEAIRELQNDNSLIPYIVDAAQKGSRIEDINLYRDLNKTARAIKRLA